MLKNAPVEAISSLWSLNSVWDPSSREAMPKDDPVNAPGKLRVAVIVSPPAGNPSKVRNPTLPRTQRRSAHKR